MADYAETRLTVEHERVYMSKDDADAPTASTTTLPTGMATKELGENSTFDVEGTGDTFDGQARDDRGWKHPVQSNSRGKTVTFNLRQVTTRDPVAHASLGLEEYEIVGLMKVKSNGYFIFVKALITRVREGGGAAGEPTWEGTAESIGPVVRGKITVWPPAS